MSQKKTIIYICQYAGTPANGMNYRPYYLGKYAVKAGYRFIVVGSGFHHQMKEPKNLTNDAVYETLAGIEYIWMPASQYKAANYVQRIKSLFEFPGAVRKFRISDVVDSDDVMAVVSSSPSLISSLPAIKWAKKLKTKFVFEVRDIWPLSLVELSNASKYNPFIMFLKYIERKSYRKADRVFTVLSNAKNYMVSNGLDGDKFRYIPNGVDRLPDELATSAVETAKAEFKGKFVVGYAGTVGVANNLINLVNAAGCLKDYKDILFVIIGEGPKKAELEATASDLDNFLFLPAVPKTEINAWISNFSVGYLGLKRGKMFEYGISPNKLFDYMLGRIPVLLAVNTANSIVEKAGCGLLVEPDDPEMLADRIKELYSSSLESRERMGVAGFEYVCEYHLYEKIAEKFVSEISSIK